MHLLLFASDLPDELEEVLQPEREGQPPVPRQELRVRTVMGVDDE